MMVCVDTTYQPLSDCKKVPDVDDYLMIVHMAVGLTGVWKEATGNKELWYLAAIWLTQWYS